MNSMLFVSHRNTSALVREFLKIRSSAGEDAAFWAHDALAGDPAPAHPEIPVFEFDADTFSRTYHTFMGDSIVPGNAHYVVLDFWRRNPTFDHYWFIEYDVRFSGNWSEFFDYFRNNPADFLSAHVCRHRPGCTWHWWGHLTHPSEYISLSERLRSFNPVFRISNRALSVIDSCHRDGWTGHHEVLLPTLLHANNCVIEDFGGRGEFVPPDRRDKFYHPNRLFHRKLDWATGTHRFIPPKAFMGIRRNTIHHPVKPLPVVLSYFFRRLREKISTLKRRLRPGK